MNISITNQTTNQTEERNSYDKLPYTSYPFEMCCPYLLRARAILFGLNPPELKNARILDLGCSDGGNLMMFAENYPESYSLGVDLSKTQIEYGKNKINQLNLKNIELLAMSITDLDESYGKFDYIICHGVYSWVPEHVREKILTITKTSLSKNGVAMISYNTLPGWNISGMIRDMMIYHTKNLQNESEKVVQAKLLLDFVNEALKDDKSPYADFIRMTAKDLSDKDDSYLLHEYLIGENKSYYFHEFVKDVRNCGLEYLAETDLIRMYAGNLPPMISQQLSAIKNVIELEQYLDFINNTPFRSTMLCHQDSPINRNINIEVFQKFYICSEFDTDEQENENTYINGQDFKFYPKRQQKNITVNTSSPGAKAIIYTLRQNIGNPLKIDEIIAIACKRAPSVPKSAIEQDMAAILGQLVFSGFINLFADKPIFTYTISEKPKVSLLARNQKHLHNPTGKYWLTSQINSVIGLEPYAVYVVRLLDGKHSLDEIKSDIFQKLKDGTINAHKDEQKIKDEQELKKFADFIVMRVLDILRVNFGLVS